MISCEIFLSNIQVLDFNYNIFIFCLLLNFLKKKKKRKRKIAKGVFFYIEENKNYF
jgi:hypothetical protein